MLRLVHLSQETYQYMYEMSTAQPRGLYLVVVPFAKPVCVEYWVYLEPVGEFETEVEVFRGVGAGLKFYMLAVAIWCDTSYSSNGVASLDRLSSCVYYLCYVYKWYIHHLRLNYRCIISLKHMGRLKNKEISQI